ncbi:hypothetical protein [Lentzea sp. NEAU-D7]|uniref:hypothetical protein n=1 Tax=Lentzea sp. NEAU-D7 TaxID=2994667 RepID=UPI00224AC358|nr:hypothetical protein [Lentzea sp. NEAU-D7]MCX2954549.1 hypothetical protein [Lentzea sp. NEAU-D7]
MPHDLSRLIELLAVNDTMTVLETSDNSSWKIRLTALVSKQRSVLGSPVGGLLGSQEMLDFCDRHEIASDVEVISCVTLTKFQQPRSSGGLNEFSDRHANVFKSLPDPKRRTIRMRWQDHLKDLDPADFPTEASHFRSITHEIAKNDSFDVLMRSFHHWFNHHDPGSDFLNEWHETTTAAEYMSASLRISESELNSYYMAFYSDWYHYHYSYASGESSSVSSDASVSSDDTEALSWRTLSEKLSSEDLKAQKKNPEELLLYCFASWLFEQQEIDFSNLTEHHKLDDFLSQEIQPARREELFELFYIELYLHVKTREAQSNQSEDDYDHSGVSDKTSFKEYPDFVPTQLSANAPSGEWYVLFQQTKNETQFPYITRNSGYRGMCTGYMGDCVTMIVLCQPREAGGFNEIRGWHGSGGYEAINRRRLMAGVSDDRSVLVLMSPDVWKQPLSREPLIAALDAYNPEYHYDSSIYYVDFDGNVV